MKQTVGTKITLGVAFSLAAFSGGVATFGLTKFAPGSEMVIAAMGILFEMGKLSAFALMHKKMNLALKGALLFVGLVLMSLNIAGVAGFLSNQYERQQIAAKASAHTNEATSTANAKLVERQLVAAESNLAQAQARLIRAKDDKGEQKAARAIITTAQAERDALIRQSAEAQASKAKVEGATIAGGSEFAAIAFIAAATGTNADAVAHVVILVIASLPDVLAVLLLLSVVGVREDKTIIGNPQLRNPDNTDSTQGIGGFPQLRNPAKTSAPRRKKVAPRKVRKAQVVSGLNDNTVVAFKPTR